VQRERDQAVKDKDKENRKLRKALMAARSERPQVELQEALEAERSERARSDREWQHALEAERSEKARSDREWQEKVEEGAKREKKLREELEAARSERAPAQAENYLMSFRIINRVSDRTANVRFPADDNRTIQNVLMDERIRNEDNILKFDAERRQRLQKKELSFKLGIWDPSRAEDDYAYIYGVEEMRKETTLDLYSYLTRDGMDVFRQKYEPIHLCIFLKETETKKEGEEDYLF